MKKSITLLAAFIMTIMLHSQAFAAKVVFGDKEAIRFIANTTIPSPTGERLFLGRRVLTKSFGLPYNTIDEGYVLGVSGSSSKYYPLPEGNKLTQLQSMGYLPNPLPAYEQDWLDYVFGHLLWFFVLAVLGWVGFKYFVGQMRRK